MILNNILRLIVVGNLLLLSGCETPPRTGMPQYTQLPVSERPSNNFGARRPNFVILHHTADNSAEDSLRTLTNPKFEVSSHYLIGRDGTLYYLVDELARAWHAGDGYWGGTTDLNSVSIGIELDNNGNEPFAEPMIATLLQLLDEIKTRYKIPTANFLAHGDIIPGRKVDPSRFFPWKRLAERGQSLPRVFRKEPERDVVGRAAPRLHRQQLWRETRDVGRDRDEIARPHPGGEKRLVRVAHGGLGDGQSGLRAQRRGESDGPKREQFLP